VSSLLDIAPARESVPVAGVALEVRSISAADIATLMLRFGDVFELLQGDVARAGETLQPAIAAVIAASVGELGNPEYEAKAAELGIADQAALLAAIKRLTMPRGIRPFVRDLASLGLPVEGALELLEGPIGEEAIPSRASSPAPSSD